MYPGDVLLLSKADRLQEGRILVDESTSRHHQHKGKLLVLLCFQGCKNPKRKLLDRHLCLPFPSSSSLSSPGKLRTDILANMKLKLHVSRASSLPHAQRYWCGRTCMPCPGRTFSFVSQSEVKWMFSASVAEERKTCKLSRRRGHHGLWCSYNASNSLAESEFQLCRLNSESPNEKTCSSSHPFDLTGKTKLLQENLLILSKPSYKTSREDGLTGPVPCLVCFQSSMVFWSFFSPPLSWGRLDGPLPRCSQPGRLPGGRRHQHGPCLSPHALLATCLGSQGAAT